MYIRPFLVFCIHDLSLSLQKFRIFGSERQTKQCDLLIYELALADLIMFLQYNQQVLNSEATQFKAALCDISFPQPYFLTRTQVNF